MSAVVAASAVTGTSVAVVAVLAVRALASQRRDAREAIRWAVVRRNADQYGRISDREDGS